MHWVLLSIGPAFCSLRAEQQAACPEILLANVPVTRQIKQQKQTMMEH